MLQMPEDVITLRWLIILNLTGWFARGHSLCFAIDFLNFNLLDCIADIEEQKACKGMCYAFPEYCLWGG